MIDLWHSGDVIMAGWIDRVGAFFVGQSKVTRRRRSATRKPSFEQLDQRKLMAVVLDTTFSGDGITTSTIMSSGNAVAIQSDGKIVVGGYKNNGASTGEDFVVARYTTAGSLDKTFSGDGWIAFTMGNTTDERVRAIAIQSDGKIVVAGSSGDRFAVARLSSTGVLDSTFSSDGKAYADLPGTSDRVAAIAIQSDKKIVVAGYTLFAGDFDFAVARFTTGGSLDASFSGDGMLTTDFEGSASDEFAIGIRVDSSNRITVAGYQETSSGQKFAQARYLATGALDRRFDGDGKQLLAGTVPDIPNFFARGASITPDLRVLILGSARSSSGVDRFGVIRANANGKIDTTFNSGQVMSTAIGSDATALAAAVQADGKYVIVGVSDGKLALLRYKFT